MERAEDDIDVLWIGRGFFELKDCILSVREMLFRFTNEIREVVIGRVEVEDDEIVAIGRLVLHDALHFRCFDACARLTIPMQRSSRERIIRLRSARIMCECCHERTKPVRE